MAKDIMAKAIKKMRKQKEIAYKHRQRKYTIAELKLIEENMPNYPCQGGGELLNLKCRRCFLLWTERFPKEVNQILKKKEEE